MLDVKHPKFTEELITSRKGCYNWFYQILNTEGSEGTFSEVFKLVHGTCMILLYSTRMLNFTRPGEKFQEFTVLIWSTYILPSEIKLLNFWNSFQALVVKDDCGSIRDKFQKNSDWQLDF